MARGRRLPPVRERLVKAAKKGYIWGMTDYLFARPKKTGVEFSL
jgi:hypothetical protein